MLSARLTLAAAAFCAASSFAAAKDVPPVDVKIVEGTVAAPVSDAPPSVAEVGPPLDGVAERWSPEQLRAIVVNSKAVFGEQTVMPGFYSLEAGKDVRKDLIGKTILTAEQVESIVAYLATLK